MPKTAIISARIDPELKNNAENVFKELGLTAAQAITLFYKQVELQNGLPFNVKIPTQETKDALEDAKSRKNLKSYNNTDDLYNDLGI
jgi:DNA-damage-inducible protein J